MNGERGETIDGDRRKTARRNDTQVRRNGTSKISLVGRFDVAQLVVMATTTGGERIDVSRMAKYQPSSPIVSVTAGGFVRALADGSSDLTVTVGSQSAHVPVTVSDATAEFHADFVHDVAPLLVAHRLQRRHLPRGSGRQERLQALPPRLRSDLRRAGADRRSRRRAGSRSPRRTTA